ncbi:MAG: DNA polymerase IV [Candidatus Delongbacteria bacterium]
MERCYLHVDMDAFFAAVEQRDNPALRGRGVVIGGGPPPWGKEGRQLSARSCEDAQSPEAAFSGRGIVTTCSYEARAYGIHSGMPIAEAWRRCPDAVYLPGSRGKYGAASEQVMAILGQYTPDLDVLSVDEASLEVSRCSLLFGGPWEIARTAQARVRSELGLSCSIGIGPNPLLAKMASKLRKPAGLFEIPADQAQQILAPLDVQAMHGIGESTATKLRELGIHTLGQLADFPTAILARRYGPVLAGNLQRLARGEGGRVTRPFGYSREEKSVGHSRTFGRDLKTRLALEAELLDLTERVCRRLREAGLAARQLTLQLRSPDFQNRFRQQPLHRPSQRESDLYAAARHLLHENWQEGEPLRLIGVSAGRLSPLDRQTEQLGLLDGGRPEKENRLNRTLDELKDWWGRDVISRCQVVMRKELRLVVLEEDPA